jgi:hypothetical protein
LLDAMFQIPLVTSHFTNQKRGQGLTRLERVFAILFLGVHYSEVLDSARDGAQPQRRCGWTAPGLPGHPRCVLAKHTGVDRIGLATFPQRLGEATRTPRVY